MAKIKTYTEQNKNHPAVKAALGKGYIKFTVTFYPALDDRRGWVISIPKEENNLHIGFYERGYDLENLVHKINKLPQNNNQ